MLWVASKKDICDGMASDALGEIELVENHAPRARREFGADGDLARGENRPALHDAAEHMLDQKITPSGDSGVPIEKIALDEIHSARMAHVAGEEIESAEFRVGGLRVRENFDGYTEPGDIPLAALAPVPEQQAATRAPRDGCRRHPHGGGPTPPKWRR